MFPVVPLNGRVIADRDVMIGGYHFSKNVGMIFCLNIEIVKLDFNLD